MIIKGNLVLPEGVMRDACLEIEDGRISSVSAVSPGGPIIDCRGCWVMPGTGLADDPSTIVGSILTLVGGREVFSRL